MQKITICLLLGLAAAVAGLVVACQSPTTKPVAKQPVAKSLEQQLTDSLRRYWHLSSFRQDGDSARYVLYGQETTACKVGALVIKDSVLLLYQASRQGMRLVTRVPFPTRVSEFRAEDLNSDGQDDFMVFGAPNMHGQASPFVFIRSGQTLRYRPDITMLGLSYDPSTKLVQAYYMGGAFGGDLKCLYQWQHDSLKQVAGAELIRAATQWSAANPPVTANDYLDVKLNSTQVRVFRLHNGKKYNLRTYHSEAVFDTILFTQDYCR
ncbi:MAG: hypothetical protein ACRYFX_01315 [Janthinobacterium lividum]